MIELAPGEKKLHGAVFAEGIPNKSSFAEALGSNLSKNRAAEANRLARGSFAEASRNLIS